jgi:hypothetical protein
MNKTIAKISFIIGLLLVILALMYWLIPGRSLPAFIPGYGANLTVTHFKRGVASFILGLCAFAFGWYKLRKKDGVE